MKRIFSSFCIFCAIALGGIVVFGQNYKIKQSSSMSGHNTTSTVFVKASRKRTESSGMMGTRADVATIEQCDLNRTVEVNDKKKAYYVQPNASGETPRTVGAKPPTAAAPKPTKGGTITQISVITDTGERKQMFGLTARHIKTSMTMKSSPDACTKTDMTMETDGWYVDLPQFSCPAPNPGNSYAPNNPVNTGCQDTYVTKSSGDGKLGFPLEMTQTMRSGYGTPFTQTISTVEFSKATLDDALFNVPADYRLAASSQDLSGTPDYSAMMSGQESAPAAGSGGSNSSPKPVGKKPGIKRIGVLMPTNRSSEPMISPAGLQAYLAQQLTSGKVEGMAVASEADARAAGCDYVLTTDISKLKQSTAGKIGGLFGGVTGAPTAGKYEAQVDYSLVSLADGKSALKSKSANKAETDPSRAAESVLAMEAQAVIAAAK